MICSRLFFRSWALLSFFDRRIMIILFYSLLPLSVTLSVCPSFFVLFHIIGWSVFYLFSSSATRNSNRSSPISVIRCKMALLAGLANWFYSKTKNVFHPAILLPWRRERRWCYVLYKLTHTHTRARALYNNDSVEIAKDAGMFFWCWLLSVFFLFVVEYFVLVPFASPRLFLLMLLLLLLL